VTSAACAPIGVRHAAHQQHVRAGQGDQRDRISTTCHSSIWPKFIMLKNAPTPAELSASVTLAAIYCE
jgi:hypothetical protein